MEANFFRFALEDLLNEIRGHYIRKVYIPARGIWTFSFGGSLHLVFFSLPRQGGFFLTPNKPANPREPTAGAMWMRKKVKNQKIVSCTNVWPLRKAAFELSSTHEFLVLDIRKGVSVQPRQDDLVGDPVWPDLDEALSNPRVWEKHPQITPPLRQAISALSREKAQMLLNDLKHGKANNFYLCRDKVGLGKPLPFLPPGSQEYQVFGRALEAARAYGEPLVNEVVGRLEERTKSFDAEIRRLNRNLARIEKDRARLAGMVEEARLGQLIKANLFLLDSGIRKEEVLLKDENGIEQRVLLDPRLTVLENMERFFKRSAKGRRGLDFVLKREKEIMEKIRSATLPPLPQTKGHERDSGFQSNNSFSTIKKKARLFRSSDGFLIMRARNREAGHKLLSTVARSHDLWFHVQGGPGAHVILKRDHDQVEVPRRSLEEAANLAALSSYKKMDLKAAVYCARAGDVRKVKGLDPGRVVVDRNLKSILVKLDPDMEKMLEIL